MQTINRNYFPITRSEYNLVGSQGGVARAFCVGYSRGGGYSNGEGVGCAYEENDDRRGRESGRGAAPGAGVSLGLGDGRPNETD